MTGIERLSGGSILASRELLKGRAYCRDASQKHVSLNFAVQSWVQARV